MPSTCPRCGSELYRRRDVCTNHDNEGIPCHGLSDVDAALQAARRVYLREGCDLVEFEARVAAVLADPPKRRFSVITVFR